jgi:hypothetical protein
MTVANDMALLDRITNALDAVPGVRAIVLGGSRARGLASEHSDYDIGIYCDGTTPLDVAALRLAVAGLDDRGTAAEITEIGGWGPWINGGGWLTISSVRVDLLYRDLARVRTVIDECRAGGDDLPGGRNRRAGGRPGRAGAPHSGGGWVAQTRLKPIV